MAILGDSAISSSFSSPRIVTDENELSHEPQSRKANSPLILESLPAELRLQILHSITDIATLKALIYASPIYHEQFCSSRNSILRSCLGLEIGDAFVDAYATFNSSPSVFGTPRTTEKVVDFLKLYHSWQSGEVPVPNMSTVSTDAFQWLLEYHTSVVLPVARYFASAALSKLQKACSSIETSTDATLTAAETVAYDAHLDLSRSEMARIIRALYRYALYYHLLGFDEWRSDIVFEPWEIVEMFWNHFEPWESDQIGCIDVFLRQRLGALLNEVKEDLHPMNPRFGAVAGTLPIPPGSHEIEEHFHSNLEGTIGQGLDVSAQILKAANDHDILANQLSQSIENDHYWNINICETQRTVALADRRDNVPQLSIKDEAEAARVPMKFKGDNSDGPPFAWILLWNGIYVNFYGEVIPDRLRETGWVMWDARRFESALARQFIETIWEVEPDALELIKNIFLEPTVEGELP